MLLMDTFLSSKYNLRANWKFLLISQIFRSPWMIEPQEAITSGETISSFNRDWHGIDSTTELNKERPKLPVVGIIGGTSQFSEKPLDELPENSFALIPLKGTMLKYGTLCSYGTEEIASAIIEAASHKNINSIVLDIDSGGGTVDSIAPLQQAIEKAQKNNKPVIAHCDTSASASYWVAACCDKIIANNDISSRFGSIGVMINFTDVQPHYEKLGYKFHDIYAPESTHKNLPFENALKGNYDLIKKEMLSPLAIRFQEHVKAHRKKLIEETEGILSGKMFFAKEAVKIGLADSIGSLDFAINEAQNMTNKYLINQYTNSKI
jgi:protease IV